MDYKITVSPRALKEIEKAIDYYALNSNDAPFNFIESLKETYSILSSDPFYRIRYKNIRALKIPKFPYLLYFEINESQNNVRILSCFHGRRNPIRRPKK